MDPMPGMRKKLANHYIPRLKYHVQSLLKQLERHDVIAGFARDCRGFQSGTVSALALVELADRVSSSQAANMQITTSYDDGASSRILSDIQCIRRPLLTCDALYDAARRVDGFQQLQFLLLTGYKAKEATPCTSPSSGPLNELVECQLAKPKWVHAEIRMITYLLNYDGARDAFRYLGISKKTCFLCGHIIQKLGNFNTRGNHGKIYSQWTIPSALELRDKKIETWELTIKYLQDVLQSEATRKELPHLQAVKESTVTTPVAPQIERSNVFTSHIPDPRLRERESTWLSSFSMRDISE